MQTATRIEPASVDWNWRNKQLRLMCAIAGAVTTTSAERQKMKVREAPRNADGVSGFAEVWFNVLIKKNFFKPMLYL